MPKTSVSRKRISTTRVQLNADRLLQQIADMTVVII